MLGEGKLIELRSQYMPGSKAEAAATVLGVGRAAFDYAMSYAKVEDKEEDILLSTKQSR